MYKIIKMSADLEDCAIGDETLELLDKSFNSIKEAQEFISTTIFTENEQEWADLYTDEDDVETELDKYDEVEFNICNYFEDECYFIEKYKIVEVK